MLPVETLQQLLSYDPDTGLLTWLERDVSWFRNTAGRRAEHAQNLWNSKHAGKTAFTSKDTHGYFMGAILGQAHLAHRVAWALHTGSAPTRQIDHVNHLRTDNRATNLREVDVLGNRMNHTRRRTNTSGHTGVVWHPKREQWIAQVKVHSVNHYLGLFADYDTAVAARLAKQAELGFHPNHGKEKV